MKTTRDARAGGGQTQRRRGARRLRASASCLAVALGAGMLTGARADAASSATTDAAYFSWTPPPSSPDQLVRALEGDAPADGGWRPVSGAAGLARPLASPVSREDSQRLARESGRSVVTDSRRFAAADATPAVAAGPSALSDSSAAAAGLTFDECWANGSSSTPQGYTRNHFAWCQYGFGGALRKNALGVVVASVNFRITVLGFGYQGERKTEYIGKLDQLSASGDYAGTALRMGMSVTGWPTGSQCTRTAYDGRNDTVPGWKANSTTFFQFTSSPTGSAGADLVGTCVFLPWVHISAANYYARMDGTGFRCDSARYLSPAAGCIFDRTLPWIGYSVNDDDVDEAAWHIYDAQVRPELTYPTAAGKRVPGRLEGPYLHRTTSGTIIDANRTAARSTCRKVWGAYDGRLYNCDEYPFASTLEGASRAGVNYSARVISSGDNQTAGRRLGQWYSADRILNGDQFAVNIYS